MKHVKQDDDDWVEIKEDVFEEDVYSEHGREELIEEDELSILETGFMEGYEES